LICTFGKTNASAGGKFYKGTIDQPTKHLSFAEMGGHTNSSPKFVTIYTETHTELFIGRD
jgi:hypothetical protein